MTASRLSICVALAAAAVASTLQNRAYADSPFRFPPFPDALPSPSVPSGSLAEQSSKAKAELEEPKGAGFNPEAIKFFVRLTTLLMPHRSKLGRQRWKLRKLIMKQFNRRLISTGNGSWMKSEGI